MKRPRLSLRRVLLLLALLLLAAGLVAPYLHADRFGQRIREVLEQSLGRRVEMGDVRFSLFRGPGFSISKVVIHEDPAAGIEPFAYVDSLEARVSFSSLLTGRLEFSSLRFVDPSVNLVKTPAGSWNFQPLLSRAATAELPEIHVRGGRLNFKFNGVKSVFYFANADLDLDPPSRANAPFDLKFSGEPARTDRTALALGRLSGRGRWTPSRRSEGRLLLDLNLERSAIGELVTLIHGNDIGVHGRVSAHARLQGPISSLDINGGLQLDDIHRWDLMPPYAEGGPLSYHGKLNLLTQSLEMETVPAPNSTLSVRFRATDYLSQPRWALSWSLNRLPLMPVLNLVRHMGAPIPEQMELEGSVTGALDLSSDGGFRGRADLEDATAGIPGYAPVRLEEAQVYLEGDRFRMTCSLTGAGQEGAARMAVDYLLNERRLDLRISTDSLSIAGGGSDPGPLLGMVKPPLFDAFRDGAWSGSLRYRRQDESPGLWSGNLRLRDTRISIPALAESLAVLAADVNLLGNHVDIKNIHGRLGKVEIAGEYHHQPGARRPDRWVVKIPEMKAAELERLLAPALDRRQGFLSRAFGLGRTALPNWLQNWHTRGTIEIGSLSLDKVSIEKLKLMIFWDGADLEVTDLAARVRNGQFRGRLSVELGGAAPVYELGGRVQSMQWQGGRVDWDLLLRTSGKGVDTLLNLKAEGAFRGRSVAIGPELHLANVSGNYDLAWRRGQPFLSLSELRLVTERGVFVGKGESQANGRLRIDLSRGEEDLTIAGTLIPLQMETLEGR